jgi:membrane-bound lytic murein transglycosylase A
MRKYFLLLLLFISSCAIAPKISDQKRYNELILKPIRYSKLPNWEEDDTALALISFEKSCEIMKGVNDYTLMFQNLSQEIEIYASDIKEICQAVPDLSKISNEEARAFFKFHFTPYKVMQLEGDSLIDKGKFTGYYETHLKGDLKSSDKYYAPLYSLPSDLIKDEPYLTRKEIEEQTLIGKSKPILWLDDEVDAFYLHIQGSGIAELPSGDKLRIAYAGNNNHEFKGIGSILMEEGIRPKDGYSAQAVKAWLKENREQGRKLMLKNPRYIFFRILGEESAFDGPIGGFGVSLTPGRSLAIDTDFIPYSFPLFVTTQNPIAGKINALMIAQDKGKAIKGAIRGDIFFGNGSAAFEIAGKQNAPGSYYILIPKNK